ncbi:MAG: patatin-like phospholipase family protein [Candidatus Omnitrophota bacterium]|nr:patatin-like phospholipase family protein [Candidatus Omnitrophota bacterium]
MEAFKYFQDKSYIVNQLPIFAELNESERALIAELCQFVEYKKFEEIYSELDPPNKFYLIVTGRIEIYTSLRTGKEEALEYLRRGQFFGIISLLTGDPHSVSARAINDSVILTLNKDDFERLLKKIPNLSLYFGQYLSRRLKRKDLHPKFIFESTIISVYSNARLTGKTLYSTNLALSLYKESGKKVALADMSPNGDRVLVSLGESLRKTPITLKEIFVDDNSIKNSLIKLPIGIDILPIAYSSVESSESFKIGALLGLLTSDYHYIILDLPQEFDESIFRILTQSDLVHLITIAEEDYLNKTADLIENLKRNLKSKNENIKIIVNEYEFKETPHAKRLEILKHNIYATLPNIEMHFSLDKEKIVLNYPESSYARVIRRIAREVSHMLTGLALGCGGAMGLADIGILKVFEREKIPIDIISGTSIGGMIASFWAAGYSSNEIEKIFKKYCKKINLIKLLDFVFPKRGFIKGKNIEKFLRRYLGGKTFYDLKMPLKIIACDLVNRTELIIDKGSIVTAIRASIATPGVFEPVEINKRMIVDGGILNPLPTNVLIQYGVSKVISVNTLPGPASSSNLRKTKHQLGIFDSIVISIQATEYIIAEKSCENSDITLRPILDDINWFDFYRIDRLIKRGEEEAEKFLPKIKQLIAE